MVNVIVLDLGDTLVDDTQPLPNVKEALEALLRLKGSSGDPLQLALVSDFHPADPPTAAGVKARFSEYLELLDGFGLRQFFDPVDRHVTLSTHAGVRKPDRRVYELALERLGTGAELADCLSITENAGHVAACRALGMRALQFGVDFTDWSVAPLLVRHEIDATNAHNTELALAVWLTVHQQRQLDGLASPPTATGVDIRLRPLGPPSGPQSGDTGPSGPLSGDTASITFDPRGRVAAFDLDLEKAVFHRSLAEHGQLAPAGEGPMPPGTTHRVETDDRGEPVIRRGRFSAF